MAVPRSASCRPGPPGRVVARNPGDPQPVGVGDRQLRAGEAGVPCAGPVSYRDLIETVDTGSSTTNSVATCPTKPVGSSAAPDQACVAARESASDLHDQRAPPRPIVLTPIPTFMPTDTSDRARSATRSLIAESTVDLRRRTTNEQRGSCAISGCEIRQIVGSQSLSIDVKTMLGRGAGEDGSGWRHNPEPRPYVIHQPGQPVGPVAGQSALSNLRFRNSTLSTIGRRKRRSRTCHGWAVAQIRPWRHSGSFEADIFVAVRRRSAASSPLRPSARDRTDSFHGDRRARAGASDPQHGLHDLCSFNICP